jgi:hypothetical protein
VSLQVNNEVVGKMLKGLRRRELFFKTDVDAFFSLVSLGIKDAHVVNSAERENLRINSSTMDRFGLTMGAMLN